MTLPRILAICCGLIGVGGFTAETCADETANSARPNVLLLMTDQQTLRAMSAYGNRYLHTPNMDTLALSGVRFAISYCTAPVCGPARSSILTGRMPHETGVNLNGDTPDGSIPNLGQIFHGAGYETAWVGKWHLPASYPRPPSSTVPGFDYLHVPEGTRFTLGEQTDAAVADQAVAFLDREHNRPWLLGVSLHNPHDICLWVREKPVQPINVHLLPPLPDNFPIAADEPSFLADCRQPKTYGVEQQYTDVWDETQWRAYLYSYYRLTEQVDRCIGRILSTLRDRGLRENTLIVFTSDHGEGVAGHRLIVKLTPYDGATAVPLICSWPGVIPQGLEDAEHPVSAIDIVPTLCDYAQVPSPPVTGISLRPWIEQKADAARECVVCELSPFRLQPERQGRILRTRRYKYMAFTDGIRPEMLFDMEADPGETHNLAYDPEHQHEVARHRDLLSQWITKTKDDFTARWID
jgi:arylsulfatase A-like enzyme